MSTVTRFVAALGSALLLLALPTATGAGAAPARTTTTAAAAPTDASVATGTTSRTWSAARLLSPRRGGPNDVSCPVSGWCMSVDQNGGAFRWSSGTWHTEPRLPDVDTGRDGFSSVSCPTTTFCLATTYSGSLAEWHGPGRAWELTPTSRAFIEVSCSSATSCGLIRTGSTGTGSVFVRWTAGRLSSPISTGGADNPAELSCPSSICFFLTSEYGRVSVHRAGASTITSTALGEGSDAQLSCSSSTRCLTVFDGDYRRLVDGRWSAPRQVRADTWVLSSSMDLSCPTGSSTCVVLGTSAFDVLAVQIAGSSLTRRTIGTGVNTTRFLSCRGTTFCMAVDRRGLATRWDGTRWSTRTPFDLVMGDFSGLDCVRGTDCLATDDYGNALEWDGSRWSRRVIAENRADLDCAGSLCMTFSPNAQTWRIRSAGTWGSVRRTVEEPYGALACPSSSRCFSVGGRWYHQYASYAWSETRSLPVDLGDGYYVRADCPRADFCLAVGSTGATVSWDGTRWVSRGSIPVVGTGAATDLDCVGRTFCLATSERGSYVFDGARWTRLPRPADGFWTDGIGCLSSTECYTLWGRDLWRWSGSRWSLDTTDLVPQGGRAIFSCVPGSGRCVVVADESVVMSS